MTLDEMKNVDIRTVDPATLVDIRELAPNADLPQAERVQAYRAQIGNPYCFKYGDIVIKIIFDS